MEIERKTEIVKLFGETYKIEYFPKSNTVKIYEWFHKKSMWGDKYGYKPIYQGLSRRIVDMAEVVKKLIESDI